MEKSIVDYEDYRDFLKSRFAAMKSKRKDFSFGYCAKKLKSGSGYLKEIFSKKKKIGFDRISPVAELFRFSVFEQEYFTIKVVRELTKSAKLKYYFGQVLARMEYENRSQLRTGIHDTTAENNFVLGDWLYGALLEMTSLPGFKLEPNWIKQNLIDGDSLEINHIKASIERLLDAKLLRQEKDGKWHADDMYISPDPYSSDQFKLYRSGLEKAMHTLEQPGKYRADSYFTATFAVDSETEQKLIELCAKFRREFIELMREPKSPSKIILMNLNYFNLFKWGKDSPGIEDAGGSRGN